jgi:hypothetical protein
MVLSMLNPNEKKRQENEKRKNAKSDLQLANLLKKDYLCSIWE